MVKKTHGITKDTVKRFVVDAGAVYLNYGEATTERLLGATSGGNSFTIEQEIKVIEIDGANGPIRGARRVTESIAKITANILELTTENIMLAIAGSTSTTWTDPTSTPATDTHDEIRRSTTISDATFVQNIAIVGKVSGTAENIICIIYNALADEGFELSFAHKEEGILETTFTAHYDPDDVDTEPWAIRYPKAISATT